MIPGVKDERPRNRFPGKCISCAHWLQPGHGTLSPDRYEDGKKNLTCLDWNACVARLKRRAEIRFRVAPPMKRH